MPASWDGNKFLSAHEAHLQDCVACLDSCLHSHNLQSWCHDFFRRSSGLDSRINCVRLLLLVSSMFLKQTWNRHKSVILHQTTSRQVYDTGVANLKFSATNGIYQQSSTAWADFITHNKRNECKVNFMEREPIPLPNGNIPSWLNCMINQMELNVIKIYSRLIWSVMALSMYGVALF